MFRTSLMTLGVLTAAVVLGTSEGGDVPMASGETVVAQVGSDVKWPPIQWPKDLKDATKPKDQSTQPDKK